MYMLVGEGQENHIYAYLEYVGNTKADTSPCSARRPPVPDALQCPTPFCA